jgi:hypothetical protein
MTTPGRWFAHGECLLCGQVVAFDPERVCSHPWPPPDGPLAPICQPCITEVVNPSGGAWGCPCTRSCPAPTSTSNPPPAGEWLLPARR